MLLVQHELGTATAPEQAAAEAASQKFASSKPTARTSWMSLNLTSLSWYPQIVTSVPLAPALLAPLLASSIPHRLRDRDTQCLYLRALFVVAAQPVQTHASQRSNWNLSGIHPTVCRHKWGYANTMVI